MLQKILMFLMKKPDDKNIRIIKTVLAILYMVSIMYSFWLLNGDNSSLNLIFFGNDLSDYKLYIWLVFMAFWIPTLISWIFDKNLLKSKHTRIMQVIFWIFLIYLCGRVIPVQDSLLDITILLTLMWWFYIFAWAFGKLITKQWKRQWETIKKVRV